MAKNFKIIKKISVVDSIKTLAEGETVEIKAADFACYSSVAAAVIRINKSLGYEAFSYGSIGNGTIIKLTRNQKVSKAV